MRSSLLHGFATLASSLATCSLCWAQCERLEITTTDDQPGMNLGTSVAVSGDFLALGAPFEDSDVMWSGAVYVFSLSSGQQLFKLKAPVPGSFDLFGQALAAHGNLLIVGSPESTTRPGSVYLFDLTTGQLTGELANPFSQPNDSFGSSVACDGTRIVVGAPKDDTLNHDGGLVYVYDAATGVLTHSLIPSFNQSGDFFGYSVGISADRIVASAPVAAGFLGAAFVFDAATGAELHALLPLDDNSLFMGWSVAISDTFVAVGSPDAACAGPGSVFVYDVVSGNGVHTLTEPLPADGNAFGSALAIEGDVLLASAFRDPVTDTGTVHAFDLVTGTVLLSVRPSAPVAQEEFGSSLSFAGDRFVVGTRFRGGPGVGNGSGLVFAGPRPLGTLSCGPAVANSTGDPAIISAFGSAVVSDNHFDLAARKLPPDKLGYFLASETAGFVSGPGGSQGNLCLGGVIGRFRQSVQSSGHLGTLCLNLDLTALPPPLSQVQSGQTWIFQAWFRDLNPGPTSNFTDAVAVTF